MPELTRNALLGFHAFTGNDYNSAFFRRGKLTCWKTIQRNESHVKFFADLGSASEIDERMVASAEMYVNNLYGGNGGSNLDELRYHVVMKHLRKNKVPDLATVPPCKAVLQLHLARANLIAHMCGDVARTLPSKCQRSQSMDGSIQWVVSPFPADVEDILEQHNEVEYGSDGESDSDEE